MPSLELTATAMAAGGDAVARDDQGRVVFVAGALPGEQVLADLVDERRRFARAVVTEVLEPAPERSPAPCPYVAAGCGGCGWQHVALHEQRRLKAGIVAEALARIGKVDGPDIEPGPDLAALGYRTTVRAAVVDGRAGFRHRRSHDVVTVGGCLVAHPRVDEVLAEGRFGDADEVVVRVGAATGERLVLARPTTFGVVVPDDVVLVGADELAAGRRAWYHEEVAGRTWRISATSFFQARPDGAAALVEVVRAAALDHLDLDGFAEGGGAAGPRPVDGPRRLVDLYAGVGLFAGTVGESWAGPVLAVERDAAAAHDARHNLADRRASAHRAHVVRADVSRWRSSPADVVIADPARAGLGAVGTERIAATGARLVVVLSCDAAALGRDAGLLAGHGYRLARVTMVDLFAHTAHVEVVSCFVKARSSSIGDAGSRRPRTSGPGPRSVGSAPSP